MNVYYDKEKKEPVWPWDVEGLRKNVAKLNANYHEYTSITGSSELSVGGGV